jgi:hypothetical protein
MNLVLRTNRKRNTKDRTENLGDYFRIKKVCRLEHVWRWLNLFHLFNQEEVIKIVQKLRGMIV